MGKAVITVIGKDKVGIMASICNYLAENSINILDITQTVLKGYFNMMMIVDISSSKLDVEGHCDKLEEIGKDLGVEIKFQPEEIFTQMHRI